MKSNKVNLFGGALFLAGASMPIIADGNAPEGFYFPQGDIHLKSEAEAASPPVVSLASGLCELENTFTDWNSTSIENHDEHSAISMDSYGVFDIDSLNVDAGTSIGWFIGPEFIAEVVPTPAVHGTPYPNSESGFTITPYTMAFHGYTVTSSSSECYEIHYPAPCLVAICNGKYQAYAESEGEVTFALMYEQWVTFTLFGSWHPNSLGNPLQHYENPFTPEFKIERVFPESESEVDFIEESGINDRLNESYPHNDIGVDWSEVWQYSAKLQPGQYKIEFKLIQYPILTSNPIEIPCAPVSITFLAPQPRYGEWFFQVAKPFSGACCVDFHINPDPYEDGDGTQVNLCQMMTEQECLDASGTFMGLDVSCKDTVSEHTCSQGNTGESAMPPDNGPDVSELYPYRNSGFELLPKEMQDAILDVMDYHDLETHFRLNHPMLTPKNEHKRGKP